MFNVPKRNSDTVEIEDTLEQFNDEIKFKATYPGELQAYELKNQCQQIFGPESDVCDHNLVTEFICVCLQLLRHLIEVSRLRMLTVRCCGVKPAPGV
jgi:hypothetical protein